MAEVNFPLIVPNDISNLFIKSFRFGQGKTFLVEQKTNRKAKKLAHAPERTVNSQYHRLEIECASMRAKTLAEVLNWRTPVRIQTHTTSGPREKSFSIFFFIMIQARFQWHVSGCVSNQYLAHAQFRCPGCIRKLSLWVLQALWSFETVCKFVKFVKCEWNCHSHHIFRVFRTKVLERKLWFRADTGHSS